MTELKHNKRTMEYRYRAKKEVGRKVTSLLRDMYGNRGYKVTSEELGDEVHIVALTNMKWKPVPKHIQNDIPLLVTGVVLGYDIGFLDGIVQTSEKH